MYVYLETRSTGHLLNPFSEIRHASVHARILITVTGEGLRSNDHTHGDQRVSWVASAPGSGFSANLLLCDDVTILGCHSIAALLVGNCADRDEGLVELEILGLRDNNVVNV